MHAACMYVYYNGQRKRGDFKETSHRQRKGGGQEWRWWLSEGAGNDGHETTSHHARVQGGIRLHTPATTNSMHGPCWNRQEHSRVSGHTGGGRTIKKREKRTEKSLCDRRNRERNGPCWNRQDHPVGAQRCGTITRISFSVATGLVGRNNRQLPIFINRRRVNLYPVTVAATSSIDATNSISTIRPDCIY